MYDSAVNITQVLSIGGQFFGLLKTPLGLFLGLALCIWVADLIIGRSAPSVSEGGGPGRGLAGRRRRGGRNLGPLPNWRNEDYHTTDSWDDLEQHARKVNGWDG